MKTSKPRIETLRAFARMNDGCVPSSDWTNGSGRHITRRAPPVHCELMPIWQAMALPGLSGRAAKRLNRKRPGVRKVVVITNRRAANALLKQEPA